MHIPYREDLQPIDIAEDHFLQVFNGDSIISCVELCDISSEVFTPCIILRDTGVHIFESICTLIGHESWLRTNYVI